MHDRNGTPIGVGDIVTIEARVVACYGGADYCNVQLEYGHGAEHGPANVTGTISSINTRQTLFVRKAPAQPESAAPLAPGGDTTTGQPAAEEPTTNAGE